MIINLRRVRGQLAAHQLSCLAEANPDRDKIFDDLGISPDTARLIDRQLTYGLVKDRRFEFDSYG